MSRPIIIVYFVVVASSVAFSKDNYADCPGWAKRGDCTFNPGFMFEECEASCARFKSDAKFEESEDCVPWAQHGECEKNPGYMLVSCAEACASVKSSPQTCDDDNTNCAGWAKNEQCKVNPGYMLVSCKKSCAVCPTAPAAEEKEEVPVEESGEYESHETGPGSSISALIGNLLPKMESGVERKK